MLREYFFWICNHYILKVSKQIRLSLSLFIIVNYHDIEKIHFIVNCFYVFFGFLFFLKSNPDCTASAPPNSKSACPVNKIHLVSGLLSLIVLKRVAQSIFGILMSDTTTGKCPCSLIISIASCGPLATFTSKVLPRLSFIPLRIDSSSSTNKTLSFITLMKHSSLANASFTFWGL